MQRWQDPMLGKGQVNAPLSLSAQLQFEVDEEERLRSAAMQAFMSTVKRNTSAPRGSGRGVPDMGVGSGKAAGFVTNVPPIQPQAHWHLAGAVDEQLEREVDDLLNREKRMNAAEQAMFPINAARRMRDARMLLQRGSVPDPDELLPEQSVVSFNEEGPDRRNEWTSEQEMRRQQEALELRRDVARRKIMRERSLRQALGGR